MNTNIPRNPTKLFSASPNLIRILSLLIGLIVVSLFTLTSCSKTVQPGNIGVKIKTLGPEAGVSPEALGSGWHLQGVGERVIEFPVIQRTYSYTRDANVDSNVNEEVSFADNTGLPMTADISITIQVRHSAGPKLYEKYRLSFDQLLNGPIRNDVRSAIAAETEKVSVDILYSGGRQMIIQKALAKVSNKWGKEGVMIPQMDWIGAIRYPAAILEQMQNKTRMEQAALAAKALQAQAEAEAAAKIATARGEAESIRIINEALANNPQYTQLKAIEKWDGKMPQVTGGAAPFINLKPANP